MWIASRLRFHLVQLMLTRRPTAKYVEFSSPLSSVRSLARHRVKYNNSYKLIPLGEHVFVCMTFQNEYLFTNNIKICFKNRCFIKENIIRIMIYIN